MPPLFGKQYFKKRFYNGKIGKERTCQQVFLAKHLLTTSVDSERWRLGKAWVAKCKPA